MVEYPYVCWGRGVMERYKEHSPEEKAAKINFKAVIIAALISAIIPSVLAFYFSQNKDVLASEVAKLTQDIIQKEKTINSLENTITNLQSKTTSLESELAQEQNKTASELNEDILNENAILKAENSKLSADNETLRNALQNDKQGSIPKDAIEFEGHYYMLYDYSMDWNAAKAFCEMMGGHLVTINSSYEQYFLMDQISIEDGYYSIGATDEGKSGKWGWVTDETFDYTYWYKGEPSGGKQHYAIMNFKELGRWDDQEGEPVKFICEWE